ncbi:hypothetical protein BGZ93_001586 [Podila epicladia]|nr:hypothetical protein BGZ93_001586 [Podila epicladia]
MKNLFNVLLVTTLTIAFSVAAQEAQHVAVIASAPEVPSMGPKTNGALWNKKPHHDKYKYCPKPLIITIPIPECQYDCKRKCQFGESGCEDACDAGREKCKKVCKYSGEKCHSNCTTVPDCQAKCKIRTEPCTPCNPTCVAACIANPDAPAGPNLKGHCTAACNQVGKPQCVRLCETIFKPDEATEVCADVCGSTPPDPPCTEPCECEDSCNSACVECNSACHTACDDTEYACEKACDSGADVCKDKCTYGEQYCEKKCRPCEAECEKACYADQWDCISDCKQYIGSEQKCWKTCKRDCGSICQRSCKHCDVKDAVTNAPGLFDVEANSVTLAPEQSAVDATVSEQMQGVAPAVDLSATDATVSEQQQPVAPVPAAP